MPRPRTPRSRGRCCATRRGPTRRRPPRSPASSLRQMPLRSTGSSCGPTAEPPARPRQSCRAPPRTDSASIPPPSILAGDNSSTPRSPGFEQRAMRSATLRRPSRTWSSTASRSTRCTSSSRVGSAEPAKVLRKSRAQLRPPRQRHHERGVDPRGVDGNARVEQLRVVLAVCLEGYARRLVVAFEVGERERREVKLPRAAAGRLEVVPQRAGQAVPEVRVAVDSLGRTSDAPSPELAEELDVPGGLEAVEDRVQIVGVQSRQLGVVGERLVNGPETKAG